MAVAPRLNGIEGIETHIDELVKPGREVDAHADITNLRFIGPHYAGQIEAVCGGRSLGAVLAHLGDLGLGQVVADVYRGCRNSRAGEECADGTCANQHNPWAAVTLFRLLRLGRLLKHRPELFPGYDVHVALNTAELAQLIRVEMQQTPPRTPRARRRKR